MARKRDLSRSDYDTDGSGSSNPSRRSYEIGYGKPPKERQFKPGQSGNPKGGRKPRPAVTEQIDRVLSKRLRVADGGKIVAKSILELMLLAAAKKAMQGDTKAAEFLFRVRETYKDSQATSLEPELLSQDDQAIIAKFVSDFAQGQPLGELAPSDPEDPRANSADPQRPGEDGRASPPETAFGNVVLGSEDAPPEPSSPGAARASPSSADGFDGSAEVSALAGTNITILATDAQESGPLHSREVLSQPGVSHSAAEPPQILATVFPDPYRPASSAIPPVSTNFASRGPQAPPPSGIVIRSAPTPQIRRPVADERNP